MTEPQQEKNKLLYYGIILGLAYGIVTRLVFGEDATLVSLTYLFLVPAVLGIVPLVFANTQQIASYKTIIFIPWLTVASVFLVLFISGLEESICVLILGAPFFILVTLGAFIYRLIRIHRAKHRNTLLALILLPFLLSPLEKSFDSPTELCSVSSEIIVHSTPQNVWNKIIRVPEIREEEYTAGFFNRLGIPRPIEAELEAEHLGALRIGHFEGGLKFIEHITEWQPYHKVSFDIQIDSATVRNRVFDRHVLLGNYFQFVAASYEIEPLDNKQLRLRLLSTYTLQSKTNFYNKFWGNLILQDFQDRLLAVIAQRCAQ